ncbi:unnamed protein product [Soboliphyme baturini]|uniref:Secreted protein n=1 Tax=Soboliphyme baturini TaxID=241478 RepID=A0A183IE08_9BILA|nr:unnamed protein product [Soboliphyme baturini]
MNNHHIGRALLLTRRTLETLPSSDHPTNYLDGRRAGNKRTAMESVRVTAVGPKHNDEKPVTSFNFRLCASFLTLIVFYRY